MPRYILSSISMVLFQAHLIQPNTGALLTLERHLQREFSAPRLLRQYMSPVQQFAAESL